VKIKIDWKLILVGTFTVITLVGYIFSFEGMILPTWLHIWFEYPFIILVITTMILSIYTIYKRNE